MGFCWPLKRNVTTVLLVMLLLAATTAAARERTDIITLKNGDRITGEVRKLDLGVVTVQTDAMGTVTIEWDQVKNLKSTQLFEVEDENGERYYGLITPADEGGGFLILDPGSMDVSLNREHIVRIESIEDSWRDRWRGFVDLGFSYTNANQATSLSFGSEATYRSKKFKWASSLSSIFSDRDDAKKTAWSTFNNSYTRFLTNRWFWTGFLNFESNEETNLDLRTTIGAGFGRYVLQTNRAQVGLVGGLAGNREEFSETDVSDWNLQAVLNATHEFFVFGDHDTRLSTSVSVFPNLSDWGRYRVEVSSSLRREMFNDFTLGISIYDSYDSDPPGGEEVDKNDLRFQTTLGWTF